jgi:hypothetical protein
MHWEGFGYRSLSVVAFAAERAAVAGRFKPLCAEFVMEWPEQERRYSWYEADALDDTRRYGIPARAMIIISGNDSLQGELRILAISNQDSKEPSTVRVSARGVAGESVHAAFEAACDTLSDESLAVASEYDILEIKAAERHEQPKGHALAGVRERAQWCLDVIEAHPAFVALVGIVVAAAVAILVR